MMDYLHHCRQIALLLKYARFNIHQGKKFVGVYKVKITGKRKISCRNGVSFYERVAKFNIVPALGAVSQVTKQQFTQKSNMPLHQTRMGGNIRLVFLQFLYFPVDSGKNFRDRMTVCVPYTMQKGITRFGIELYSCHSRAILPAVVLFFHEQIKLVKAPHYCSVPFLIVGEWFS
ncbi:MAG TPA: hypothetical protein VFM90_04590 [Cyclobacteriaceae bacterium]|nr:hypothetical protein [Cyclobacteriaceae bacterium]